LSLLASIGFLLLPATVVQKMYFQSLAWVQVNKLVHCLDSCLLWTASGWSRHRKRLYASTNCVQQTD